MAKKSEGRGLGRSFYDIMGDNVFEGKGGSGQSIRLSDIEPRKDQPRKTFEREALEVLADSIANYGVLQPILVRESELLAGTYEIIAGERRWRAAKMAGLSEIPAIVFDGDELKAAQVAMIENIQREDLNPVEEAMGYGALIEKFGLSQDQVAKQVGKNRSTVANMLRLLELPAEVLEMLRIGDLTTGHARALLGLKSDESMISLAQKVADNDLSVRDVERIVRLMAAEKPVVVPDNKPDAQRRVYMKDLERKVMETLGRKAKINQSAKKKTLELSYDSDADLEELLILICGKDIFKA